MRLARHCSLCNGVDANDCLLLCACRHSAMVQLSVLLCLIPLALENAMMQAHITRVSGNTHGDTRGNNTTPLPASCFCA